MKVLNRPMFRMGGPIKEGIMSGIKEPRQGYQDAGQVFKNVQANLQEGQVADPLVLQEAARLEIGNPYKTLDFKPYMKRVVTKPTDTSMDLATLGGYGEIEKPYLILYHLMILVLHQQHLQQVYQTPLTLLITD